jgi:hypothetical protein
MSELNWIERSRRQKMNIDARIRKETEQPIPAECAVPWWKPKRTEVPLWVGYLHALMEFLDYRVASHISNRLMYWRNELIERHCYCEKCIGRHPERASWRQS